ncbi:GNAT family N-acetyltransferase [Stappia taiwanensis]|uniref:GNAT family N-acetyltransferase n=1 Tax=Stappia taiwanensis TaxID=992267 RepID=A0A838Y338_9HYPH|nr:GNAT family N-acetyltransferase [Stappia taiwanensis]MBA4613300.1 GNAT family N-acetyltransferase [Stappia taiwanensis]GGE80998.1 acetyltransferase [Stappia taiwanensis]
MTDDHLAIRAFRAADTACLSEIWYRASIKAHSFLGRELLQDQRRQIEEIYLPQAETWAATISQRPVGFIGLLDSFIGGLFVDPAVQGCGIGRALVAHGLQLKQELTLEVYAQNSQAVAFYRHLGFRENGRRPRDDNGLPFENIRMHLAA